MDYINNDRLKVVVYTRWDTPYNIMLVRTSVKNKRVAFE